MCSRVLVVLALFAAAVAAAGLPACNDSVAEPATTSTTSSEGGGGASGAYGGGLAVGGSSDVPCPWLDAYAATDAGPGTSVQAWCEPGATNPSGCPADKPEPGEACASPGLRCGYATDGGFLLETCDQQWSEVVHHCALACDALDGGVPAAQRPPCGALPDVPCPDDGVATDLERAGRLFRDLAQCCTPADETTLTVSLQDGCVTALVGPPELVECLRALLAGRRLACATTVSCLEATWSTLP